MSAFDDLARSLAEPTSRRGALRLLGAAVAAAAFPALRPRAARAGVCGGGDLDCGTDNSSGMFSCCTGANDICCLVVEPESPEDRGGGFCYPGDEFKCCGRAGRACRLSEDCVNGKCAPKCPNGGVRCGTRCCPRGQACESGRCVPKCPPGRPRCGQRCCPRGQRCVGGKCRKCPSGQKACGKKCCPKGQDCCFDGKGTFVCCNTKKRSCVNVGRPGATKMTCCAEGHEGASVLGLSASGMTTGVERDAERVCCPKRRFVPRPRACCPPGYTSMEGKLVLPSGGGGGLCCRDDKACGSGSNITCCSTGVSPLGNPLPELEEVCVDGTCVRRS